MCAFHSVIVGDRGRFRAEGYHMHVWWVLLQVHVFDAVCSCDPGRSEDYGNTYSIVDLKY